MAGNLARRVAFSAVAIPAAGALVYLGGWPLAGLLALAGVLGVREIYDFAAPLGVDPLRRTGMAAALAAPLGTYWAKGSEIHFAEPALYLVAVWLIVVVALAAWRRGPTGRPLAAAAVTVFGVAYAGVLPAFAIVLRHPSGVGPASWPGTALLFFPLVLTWAGDTAAYAAGTAIGGPKLAPTLEAWRPNVAALGMFGLVLAVILLVWARASLVVFALFYTHEMPSLQGFLEQVFSLDNLEFLVAYFCVGGFFALLVFAISAISVPMMMDRDTDGIVAVLTSVKAFGTNLPAMLLWAFIITVVIGAGFALWFLGLIVAVPVIGHGAWHAYRDSVA